jgi:iron complex outermembrane receptor protein
MKKLFFVWLFILLSLSSSFVSATEPIITLEDLVVTATRYEEIISTVPASVTVITGDDIEKSSAKDVPELLETQDAIHVSDITGNQRSFSVDLRGFGETASSNTLLLIDGRRVNEPDLSAVDWTLVPLKNIERIEIIRGGRGSVLYGDNASGGVINIITKEGDALSFGGELAAGSYGTFKSNAYVSGKHENLSYYISGNYVSSDGYRDNSDTEAEDVGLNLNYYMSDFLKIDMSSGYHHDKTGLPGALKESDFDAGASRTDSTHPHDYIDVEDYYFKGGPKFYFLDDNEFTVDVSYRKRDFLSFATGDFGYFEGDSEIETVTLSPQVLMKNSLGKTKNALTFGIDYSQNDNDIVNESLFFGDASIGKYDLEKKNYGYYVHNEITIADKLYLSGGYRYDKAEFTFHPSTPDEIDMSKDLYTAGINYAFYRKSYIYFSFSRSFRYPLLDELYSFFTNTVNTRLKPQETDDFEIGMRHHFIDDAYVHLNVFRMDTDDEIVFNPITYINENLDGKTRRDGIELSIFAKPFDWLALKGAYTYIDAEIRGGEFDGSTVPNVPEHTVSFDVVSAFRNGLAINLNGSYVGERPFISDFSNNYSDQESYFILNSMMQYRIKYLKLFLAINNILDEEYSEYGVLGGFPLEKSYYPSPERNFLAGLSFDF